MRRFLFLVVALGQLPSAMIGVLSVIIVMLILTGRL